MSRMPESPGDPDGAGRTHGQGPRWDQSVAAEKTPLSGYGAGTGGTDSGRTAVGPTDTGARTPGQGSSGSNFAVSAMSGQWSGEVPLNGELVPGQVIFNKYEVIRK